MSATKIRGSGECGGIAKIYSPKINIMSDLGLFKIRGSGGVKSTRSGEKLLEVVDLVAVGHARWTTDFTPRLPLILEKTISDLRKQVGGIAQAIPPREGIWKAPEALENGKGTL